MVRDVRGMRIKEKVKCRYCGEEAEYHHVAEKLRKDKYVTVWYKCPHCGRRTFKEVQNVRSQWEMP